MSNNQLSVKFYDDNKDYVLDPIMEEFKKIFFFDCQVFQHMPDQIEVPNNKKLIHFVDINHGYNKPREGFKIIEKLKRYDNKSIVIAYSTDTTLREASLQKGADDFIEKITWEEFIEDIKNRISNYLFKFIHFNIEHTYKGTIYDVKDEYTIIFRNSESKSKLEDNNNYTFQSKISKDKLNHLENELKVNDSIKMFIGSDGWGRNIIEYELIPPEPETSYFDEFNETDILETHKKQKNGRKSTAKNNL